MNPEPAHLLLKALFDEIVSEAEKNPSFAGRLLAALPKGAVAEIKATRSPIRKTKTAVPPVNPVKLLRESGDVALRNALDKLTKPELAEVVARSQLVLPEGARGKNAQKADIVEGVIQAAYFRLKERAA